MNQTDEVPKWFYRGLWGVLVRWFRVPDRPPTLPTAPGETAEAFQPAEGFLRYLKFHFWLLLIVIDVLILIGWVAITVAFPVAGIVLALPALAVAIVPDVLAYLAIHLRFDTTWYVFTSRSLRIRRGIWIIHETTLTFEHVQNVTVSQGPLQRWFGIANVLVQTAGGGASHSSSDGTQSQSSHRGLIEGVANATIIRDRLLDQLRKSHASGLGDEIEGHAAKPAWSEHHLSILRDIRDEIREWSQS